MSAVVPTPGPASTPEPTKIEPVGTLNLIQVNDKFYWIADQEIRDRIADWSASGSLEEYIPNDVATWAQDTFYKKVNNNYILLTEMPSDWAQAYTSYFKKNEEFNADGFVSTSTILSEFAKEHNFTVEQVQIINNSKLDSSVYDQLYSILLSKRVALTASYNDLVDVPSFGGARVNNHTLIFTGESGGQEDYLLEQLDLTAGIIGTGVLS